VEMLLDGCLEAVHLDMLNGYCGCW